MSRTLYDKLVDAHKVCDLPDGDMLIYVDLHIMNEYTSPQAFSGLDTKQLGVWRPGAHLAVIDHVNATKSREPHDAASKLLIDNLEANCLKHSIAFYGLGDRRQGIEHVVVPEQGLAAPGMLIACGDSHTTTYGAFGAGRNDMSPTQAIDTGVSAGLVYRPDSPAKGYRCTKAGKITN